VVRFNAAHSNYLAFARPVQDDFTIFCVFRSTQGWGSGTLYYEGAGLVNGEVAGVTTDFGTCLFANGQICAGTGDPDVAVNSAAGFNDGQPHLLTFKRTESTGEVDLYLDGNFVGSTTGSTSPLAAPNQLVLGAQQTLINFLSGDIAEVKIFNSALADADREAEENILKCKYEIAGGGTAPATPAGLNGIPGNRQISLNWSGSSGASSYSLSSSTSLNGPFLPLVSGLTANVYVDTNAVSGRTNYYEVTAVNGCGSSPGSMPVAVYLPNPMLSVTGTAAGTLSISWPGWAGDWELYFANNLNPPVVWQPVTNAVAASNGQWQVSLPVSSGTRFFRLSAP
jgi:Concanavalin A-like lectin/glucanases superfamily